MAQLVKTLYWSNSNQQLTWTQNFSATVTAYLWGAGGGAGYGNQPQAIIGGSGSGGGFSALTFTVDPGDTITVSVGGGGAGAVDYSIGIPGPAYIPANLQGYYGGYGSAAGSPGSPQGRPGGGGGGGGATVLLRNSSVIAVAPGGAGGGGGNRAGNGQNAPGFQATALGPLGQPAGGNAIRPSNAFDSGSGGGGGGVGGGAAGPTVQSPSGSQAPGLAGAYGSGLGDYTVFATGVDAAENTNSYYTGNLGRGGTGIVPNTQKALSGSPGLAVLVFQMGGGTWVNQGGFQPVSQTYVHANGIWNAVKTTWIKDNGIWKPTQGTGAVEFVGTAGFYGGPPSSTFISVIDECSRSADEIQFSWDRWLQRYPGSIFNLLQPDSRPSRLKIPPNYNSTRGFGPFEVNRDNGSQNLASNWFNICNLGVLSPGSLVYYSIDNSGSMTTSTVQASLNLFLQNCQAANLAAISVKMDGENWVQAFVDMPL